MNSDPDTIRSFLFKLLEHFSPTVSSPSGRGADRDQSAPTSPPNVASEEAAASGSGYSQGQSSRFVGTDAESDIPLSELGEMPAVQDHFQAVLKRRLQAEIEQNPPLFPWESELQEYPIELTETPTPVWLTQLRSLSLPTQLPDEVLSELLTRCQAILQESLQPGVRLVRAVESLFPEQPQAVNQIADLMLTAATARSTELQDFRELQAAFPEGYAGANPQQQVTLAMLAARDILDALTLTLTPETPTCQRQWRTEQGMVTLAVSHEVGNPDTLLIQVALPAAGYVRLTETGAAATAASADTLTLRLPRPDPQHTYSLTVTLTAAADSPLAFAIAWRNA